MHKRFTIISIILVSLSVFSQTSDFGNRETLLPLLFDGKDFVLSKSTTAYSIFSSTKKQSFVIVSSRNSNEASIIGYSDSGIWDEKNMPPALLLWLNNIEKECSNISSGNIMPRRINSRKDVPNLLTSRWHQDSPYNDLCPIITDGNVKTAAGCVAIAASQVAYYWRRDNPLTTTEDTPTYPYGKAPITYSVPAGTEFQWDLMKDYYSTYETEAEKEAVARLVYIIGTSAYLQYGISTGGQIIDIISPYSKQFRLNAKFAAKKDYSQEEWEQLIYNDLIKKQPVVYAGSTGNNAHAVVIDGYNSNLNLFHFNFGWGGSGDGYYTINDVSGMNGYIFGQECVYDIYPSQRNMSITLNIVDSLLVNTQGEIDIYVQNGSTFNIEELYLFLSQSFINPSNKDEAIWHYEGEVQNDDSERLFRVNYTPDHSGSRLNLILTDGEMNILAQKFISIHEGSGIKDILYQEDMAEEYYSIKGEFLPHKQASGICIIKKKNKTIKFVSP